MVTVAIAGATGRIGQTLLEVLREQKVHKIIALSRHEAAPGGAQAPLTVIDYDNIELLTDFLRKNHVHTVISALLVQYAHSSASEVNLVKAASRSGSVQRFIASDYAAPIPEEKQFGRLQARVATIEELRKSNLEWTSIRSGMFMDSLGGPHIKTYMRIPPINVDVVNASATIPGSGNNLIALTYTFDMAHFVAAALDLPKWDEDLYCYSDRITLNELVKLAEEARGTKFDVTFNSVEKLQRGEVTELPAQVASYAFVPKQVLQHNFAKYNLYTIEGLLDFPGEGTLNAQFPEFKTTSAKEMLKVWQGK
ncbi:hypothetical protein G7046_g6352 [Stylonectria norvegica]|nr:hypothetical protein G7046_g6352 [Stylonectria norvegica]